MADPKIGNIDFKIKLDNENIPEEITWYASDSPMQKPESCKAINLSIWDGDQKQALKIDLWTKKMTVEEMNHFLFQQLHTSASGFLNATGNEEIANELRKFADDLGKKLKVLTTEA